MIVYGPVPSRRLKISLGINNIVPPKQCSYSCVYCQVGETNRKTMSRGEFYKPEHIVKQVKAHLKKLDLIHKPDYLTIVANGEPTLDINLGIEIKRLQKLGFPVAVITNASLLDKEHTRKDLSYADWVSVKIDTVNKEVWKKINQPFVWLNFEILLKGIEQFSNDYTGILNTETMLVGGYNDNSTTIRQTAKFIADLNPSTAYISIPTRPPVNIEIKAASEQKITEAWQIFQDNELRTEILTGFEGIDAGFTGNAQEDILNMSAVHPIREDTLSEILLKDYADKNVVSNLLDKGLIKNVKYKGNNYYVRSYHH